MGIFSSSAHSLIASKAPSLPGRGSVHSSFYDLVESHKPSILPPRSSNSSLLDKISGSAVVDHLNKIKSNNPTFSAPSLYFDYSSGSSGGSSSDKQKYYEAPLAELYGFDKNTAYQEALANTAYRREMADMRKAGLNPSVLYGSHNTSGASSSIYPSSGSSGGGSSGRSYSSGRGNSGKYLFSGGAYYGIMAGVGAITAIATGNVGAGMAAAGITGTALKAFNGFFSK